MASNLKMALGNVEQQISAPGASKEIPSTVPRCLFFERYLVQISEDLNICMTRISIFKNVFPQPLHKQSLLAYVTESQYPTGIICFPGRTLEGTRNATSVLSTLIEATGMTRTEKGNVWIEMGHAMLTVFSGHGKI